MEAGSELTIFEGVLKYMAASRCITPTDLGPSSEFMKLEDIEDSEFHVDY